MTREQFESEKGYRVTMVIAKAMLNRELITEEEFQRIDEMMLEKYRPVLGVIMPFK